MGTYQAGGHNPISLNSYRCTPNAPTLELTQVSKPSNGIKVFALEVTSNLKLCEHN